MMGIIIEARTRFASQINGQIRFLGDSFLSMEPMTSCFRQFTDSSSNLSIPLPLADLHHLLGRLET